MANAHTSYDLAQLQSLPLEAKIRMTKERIKAWYESWTRFEIHNPKTGKTRFVTIDTRDLQAEPPLKDGEYIVSAFPGAVYVSFSGGKDSTVLKHIVDSMYDDVPALFVNTGLEYPEIQKFAMSQKNVVTVRPEMRFDEVLKTYGYPVISKEVAEKTYYAQMGRHYGINAFKGLDKDGNPDPFRKALVKYAHLIDSGIPISAKCCQVMKKSPAKKYETESGRKPILGTMAKESRLRYQSWIKSGCNAFDSKRPTSQPMSFWTEQDVLHYIKKYDVPYCSVYGDIQVKPFGKDVVDGQINYLDYLGYEPKDVLETTGCKRTGCIFCLFGCHLDKEPNRFQRLKKTHPRQYNYCINGGEMVDGKWQPSKEGLGLGKVLDYIGVDYK